MEYPTVISMNEKLLVLIAVLQVMLPLAVLVLMGYRRNKAVLTGEVPMWYYKTQKADPNIKISDSLELPSRNFINLFEIPVLFYFFVPLAFYFHKVDTVTVVLAGLFVLSRYIHTAIHITINKVKYRFTVYSVGLILIAVIWLRFLAQVLMS
jgi:hypothetical protein